MSGIYYPNFIYFFQQQIFVSDRQRTKIPPEDD